MSLGTVEPRRVRALLGNRDLVLLLAAGLVSQTGDWLLATGIGFQVYVLTGSTLATAGVLLATQVPQVVLSSVAGVLVDRWDRRRVMVAANLVLAVVLLPLVAVQDASRIWVVYVVVALSSVVAPFFTAAEATMVPVLVGPELLVTANAANAQVRNVARLVGAALGGVVVAAGGLTWVAGADVGTFLLAAALVALVRRRTPRTEVSVRPRLVREWTAGLAVVRRSRALLVVVAFFALSGVGESVMGALFAPFVHDVLGGSARAFGAILAVQAVGGIVGGLTVTALGHRVAPKTLFAWGALAFGALDLVLFLYPLAYPRVWPALVVIAVVGLPGAAVFAGALTVFQLATTDEVRGRVFGAVTTVQNAAMLASTLVVGTLAGRAGIVPVIAVQGAVYVLCGVLVLAFLPGAGPARGINPRAASAAAGPRRA
ncbi:MAG TPA: MFS transporter [Friedmanniella sp.]